MNDRPILAETATPDGTRVVLFEDTWREHVLDPQKGHLELGPNLEAVLAAVAGPGYRKPDGRPARERFYKKDAGPSRWLMVVVELGGSGGDRG